MVQRKVCLIGVALAWMGLLLATSSPVDQPGAIATAHGMDDKPLSSAEIQTPLVTRQADAASAGKVHRVSGRSDGPANPLSGGPRATGACCVSGVCNAVASQAECITLGGIWYEGEDCAGAFTCPPHPCDGTIYSNGVYDFAAAAHNGRYDDDSHAWRVVDDVTIASGVTVHGLHWWGNEPVGFNWSGGKADWIIYADNAGFPGRVVARGDMVSATRTDTGDTMFGDPVWNYSITGLNVELGASTYWFGMRPVQNTPYGTGEWDHGWWCTAPDNGTAHQYIDGNPPGVYSPGVYEAMAFCVSGTDTGIEPSGACCDDSTSTCTDTPPVLMTDCFDVSQRFIQDGECDDFIPSCGQALGACCYSATGTCTQEVSSDCIAGGGTFHGPGSECSPAMCPCVIECPAGGITEIEACGTTTNDGCNLPTPAFEPILVGDTVCGTVWALDGTRDTDWYELNLTTQSILTWTVSADFPVAGLIVEGNCAYPTIRGTAVAQDDCIAVGGVSSCLTSGTYYLFIGPHEDGVGDIHYGLPCPNNYVATLTAEPCATEGGACCFEDGTCQDDMTMTQCYNAPGSYIFDGYGTTCGPDTCPQPQPNDHCVDAERLTVGDTVFTNISLADDDDGGNCGVNDPGHGIWYEVTGDGTQLSATTCNPNTVLNTAMQVFCDCDLYCVDGNHSDYDCTVEPYPTNKSTVSWCSDPGRSYYIHVGGWGSSMGDIEFSVMSDGQACGPVVDCGASGRCCYDDGGPQCVDNTLAECSALGGIWTDMRDCSTPCPVPITNESCETVTTIAGAPFFESFDNSTATRDGPQGSCNYIYDQPMHNDVWYKYTPLADCDLVVDLDPNVSVVYPATLVMYTGSDCANLTEVECHNSGLGNSIHVEITGTAGTTYWFQMGKTGLSAGGGLTEFSLECGSPCSTTLGDMDGDSDVDGNDLQGFVNALTGVYEACADFNANQQMDTGDINGMISALLGT